MCTYSYYGCGPSTGYSIPVILPSDTGGVLLVYIPLPGDEDILVSRYPCELAYTHPCQCVPHLVPRWCVLSHTRTIT